EQDHKREDDLVLGNAAEQKGQALQRDRRQQQQEHVGEGRNQLADYEPVRRQQRRSQQIVGLPFSFAADRASRKSRRDKRNQEQLDAHNAYKQDTPDLAA